MAHRPFSGNNGIATASGSTLCVTGWKFNYSIEDLDTSNTCDAGYESSIPGRKMGKGSLDMNFDAGLNPFGNPPNLVPGQQIAIRLYLESSTSGAYIDCPTCLVLSADIDSKVGGVVTYNVEFKTVGTFTVPTANF